MSVTITHSESEKKRSPRDWNMTPCDDSFTSNAPSVGVVLIVVSSSVIDHLDDACATVSAGVVCAVDNNIMLYSSVEANANRFFSNAQWRLYLRFWSVSSCVVGFSVSGLVCCVSSSAVVNLTFFSFGCFFGRDVLLC
jgi:hypothetical protein